MTRLWLIFAQTTTVCLAALFVVATLKPQWLPAKGVGEIVPVLQAPRPAAASAPSAPAAGSRTDSYHEAVMRAMPSVVGIITSKQVRAPRNPFLSDPALQRFFGDRFSDEAQKAASLGSGVIVSSAGYILTNNHVVEAAEEIEIALPDGRKLLAKVVGSDPDTDLAVLRVQGGDLRAISFGASESLRVGDVVLAINEKLVRRHPHVFGDLEGADPQAVKRLWASIKAEEKKARAARREAQGLPPEPPAGALDGVPGALPALGRAVKLQERAARVGFDWPDARQVLDKIEEEVAELRAELDAGDPARLADEVGDLLFAVANLARHAGVDPETALAGTNGKFTRRFAHIEAQLAHAGRGPHDASLEEMEALWQEAKADERR